MAVCMSCKLAHRLLPLLMPRKLAEGIRKRRQVRPAPRRERYAGGAWRHLVQAGARHGADQAAAGTSDVEFRDRITESTRILDRILPTKMSFTFFIWDTDDAGGEGFVLDVSLLDEVAL